MMAPTRRCWWPAVQELSLPRIAEALISAQQRGVHVAVVLENNYSQAWSKLQPSRLNRQSRQHWHQLDHLADSNGDGSTSSEETFLRDAIALLQAANVPLIDDTEDGSSGSGLVHHKFLMIDQTKVITGSFNWSPSAAQTNDETLLVIHSPQLARITPRIQRKLNRQKIHCGDGVERG